MAYQDPKNYCLSEIVKKRNSYTASGKICIPDNPSLVRYRGEVFPLHVVVVIAPEKESTDKASDEASSETLAYSIIPKILYESVREMMDKKYAIFVNALPKQYFEDPIPNSISIPVKEHEKLSDEDRKENFNKIIQKKQLEYPHMMDLEVEEVPLVVFSAHEKCDASHILCELFRKAGSKKIFEYTGGQKDYDEKSGKTLEDSSSDEDSGEESDLADDEDNKDEEDEKDEKDTEEESDLDEQVREEDEKDNEHLYEVNNEDEEDEKEEKDTDEEKDNNEESSDEEPEKSPKNSSKRRKKKGGKKVLSGGSWCFDLSLLL